VTALSPSRSLFDRLSVIQDRDDIGDNRTSAMGKWVAKLLKRLKSFQSFENSKIFKSNSNGTKFAVLKRPDRDRFIAQKNPFDAALFLLRTC
jgi:hypothetical protein